MKRFRWSGKWIENGSLNCIKKAYKLKPLAFKVLLGCFEMFWDVLGCFGGLAKGEPKTQQNKKNRRSEIEPPGEKKGF